MQLNEVFSIWDRFEKSKATEVVIETKDGKISLKKGGAVVMPPAPGMLPAQSAAPNAGTVSAQEPEQAVSETTPVSGEVVKAPFVGTFYRASAPGAEPFIKIGQTVKKGDVVGIIEAMKMMNEIVAPCDGTVTDIYVDDETLVEFGQALVCIGD
ncbi:MAG TPA: acetyl-CoA carboxylase biotin carboxyl carrier protein [Candidatus Alectryocaccobium stercorigallinarum]|jgi:acetyl-CoA carboxylase biotin carboxyl carrier protein|nr:acetyl-CoA carboxylase biotin carboxyl carrier protein [Candidatus Alectryocaccobium stercorigallinarum]